MKNSKITLILFLALFLFSANQANAQLSKLVLKGATKIIVTTTKTLKATKPVATIGARATIHERRDEINKRIENLLSTPSNNTQQLNNTKPIHSFPRIDNCARAPKIKNGDKAKTLEEWAKLKGF